MSSNYQKIYFSAVVALQKGEHVLLARRFQTGFKDGYYALPGGHVDTKEDARDALVREIQEELGVTLDKEQLSVSDIFHRQAADRDYIQVFFTTTHWDGEPKNNETEKCDDVAWFSKEALPENTISYDKEVIAHLDEPMRYMEWYE